MKKSIYAAIALILIGGLSFAITQRDLLKGNFYSIDDGPSFDSINTTPPVDDTPTINNDGPNYGSGNLDDPDFPVDTINVGNPGGGGDNDCEAEYFINLYVAAQDGTALANISESEFDLPSEFNFSNEGNGEYEFTYIGSGKPENNYTISVDPNGYQDGSIEMSVNDSCSDLRYNYTLTLNYKYAMSVKDHEGNSVKNALVESGDNYGTKCNYWDESDLYLCATPDLESSIYQVSLEGYVSKTGDFLPISRTSFLQNGLLASLGRANLFGSSDATYTDSGIAGSVVNDNKDNSDNNSKTVIANGNVSYESFSESGNESIQADVVMDEFAWTVYVNDGNNTIKDARVKMSTPDGNFNCDYESEQELYWCSGNSYYSSSGEDYPTYEVSLESYNTVSGTFDETRTSQNSPGVNQKVTLTKTVNTDPANYCDTLTLSSSDLPLAWDANEVGTLDVELEVIAFSEDYSETLEFSVTGGNLDTYSYEARGDFNTKNILWSDASVGDVMTVSSNYCDGDSLEVTQEEEPISDTPDDTQYQLTCSGINISPDIYEISSDTTSNTLYQFELEWNVIEELIAVQNAPDWIRRSFALKYMNNPFISLASSDDTTEMTEYDPITFTLSTTGNGSLYYADDLNTAYSELTYEITAPETNSITFYYMGANAGDSLYVNSSDNACSDSITLSQENDTEYDATTSADQTESDNKKIDFTKIEKICEAAPFTDVKKGDDMYLYISCLASTGAVQGYGDGTYGPANNMTNAELVKVVVAMTGTPLVDTDSPTEFLDIEGHWAEAYIKTAEALDIARPRENVYFRPDEPATRGYLAVLLARAANQTLWGWDESDIPFRDVTIYDYYAYAVILESEAQAESEIEKINGEYILEGYSDNTFRGENNIRRDEAAAMLIRAFYAWFAEDLF